MVDAKKEKENGFKREKDKDIWKPYFRLMFKAKLPWAWLTFVIILLIIQTDIMLRFPQYTQKIIAGDISNAIIYGAVAIIVANTILSGIVRYFGNLAVFKVDVSYRKLIWRRLMRSPLSLFNQVKANEMVTRTANDTATISGVLAGLLPSIIASLYATYETVRILFGYDWRLAMAVLIFMPLKVAILIWYGKWNYSVNKEAHNRLAKLTQFLSELLYSIPLIKSFAMENKEEIRGKDTLQYYYKASFRRTIINWLRTPIESFLSIVQDLIVIGFGAYLLFNGAISTDEWVAFFLFVGMLSGMFVVFEMAYIEMKVSQGATKRIAVLVESDLEEYVKERSLTNTQQDLTFDNVHFSYGDEKVLNGLSLTIPHGKVTAIVGPSGSGKTTILSLVQQFYNPDEGKITFGNNPIDEFHLNEWRNMFSSVAQDSPLITGTFRENLVYAIDRDVTDEELLAAAEKANALNFIQDDPHGLDGYIGESGSNLSGGQRQRLSIARAFLRNTDYLLLDETMTGLDTQSEKVVQEAMDHLMEGRTSIVVAHDLATIRDADQIVVIDKGKVDGIGTHDSLIKSNNIYKSYVQFLTHSNNGS